MEVESPVRTMRLTALAVTLATALCAVLVRVGADSRWLAAIGREVMRTGSIPARIPYAAAPPAHWTNVPVLAELIFHGLEAAFGDRGLVLAQLFAVAVALTILAVDMRAALIPDAPRGIVLVAVTFAAAPALIVARSQLFSLALFPVLLWLVRAETRQPSRRVWLLVPLVALWSNLHGAVLVGCLVAGAYLVFQRLREQPVVSVSVLGASLGALFLTPALWRSGDYYVGVLHSEAARRGIGMWAPLSLHALFDVLFIVIAVPLVLLAVSSHPLRWESVCLVGLAVLAVHANRNTVWFAFFVAAPAARRLGQIRGMRNFVPRRRISTVCTIAIGTFLIVGIGHAPAQAGAGNQLLRKTVTLAHGRPILADELDAERLVLAGRRVWIANPLDAFPRREQRAYLDWLEGHSADDAAMRGHKPAVVLVSRDTPAERELARDSRYRAVARDGFAVLYVLSARKSGDLR